MNFEKLLDEVEAALRAALESAVGSQKDREKRWETPDVLAWVGLIFDEQGKFYLAPSHGKLKGDAPLGRHGFDEDGTTRLDFLLPAAAHRKLRDLPEDFRSELEAPEDLDDEDTWDEATEQFTFLAVLTALAIVGARWQRDVKALPLKAPKLQITVATDNESPTFGARVPGVEIEDDGQREALLAACEDDAHRRLLRHLLDNGGIDAPDLFETVKKKLR